MPPLIEEKTQKRYTGQISPENFSRILNEQETELKKQEEELHRLRTIVYTKNQTDKLIKSHLLTPKSIIDPVENAKASAEIMANSIINKINTDSWKSEEAHIWKSQERQINYTSQVTSETYSQEPTVEDINDLIKDTCDDIKSLLVAKNTSYAAALFFPINQFSSLSAMQTCDVLIDNKLSRLKNGKKYKDENDVRDLIGYLINKLVIKKMEEPIKHNSND